jgi:hypothetical protein
MTIDEAVKRYAEHHPGHACRECLAEVIADALIELSTDLELAAERVAGEAIAKVRSP